uniref:IPT/TIG domain-containing protein n=1 Tax=viral metagenome TaxID=1070528 RepID=A0A6C0C9T6_9ZZZZ
MSKCGPNCKCHEHNKKVIYIKNNCQNQLPTLPCHNTKPPCNPIIINLYITSLSPSSGSLSSDTTVLINGNGLTYAKAINFGNVQITTFTIINNMLISFIAPPMSPSSLSVSVSATNAVSNALRFTYVAVPSITQLIQDQGPINGSNSITILGNNLASTQSIQFGPTNITSFQVIDNNTVSFIAPSGAASIINVYVISLGGNSNNLTYEYLLPPII